jgi:hypothetical protein
MKEVDKVIDSHGNSQLINPPDKPVGFRIEILTLSNSASQVSTPKAFWRGTRNWRLNLSPIASVFSRLGKIEKKAKVKGVLWIDLNAPKQQLAWGEVPKGDTSKYNHFTYHEWTKLGEGDNLDDALIYAINHTDWVPDGPHDNFRLMGQGDLTDLRIE